jgi:glycosyltransferase involved in cell wall biosynthesis
MKKLKIAVISPITWRTPPHNYGPWEQVAYNIAQGAISKGHDVTLYATADSKTSGKLVSVCPRPLAEDETLDTEVYKFLHISKVFEDALEDKFDIIHNQFDYYPLVFSNFIRIPMVTTVNGFNNEQYKLIYKKYNNIANYVSISNADRTKELDYVGTVYNGINLDEFEFNNNPKGDYLLSIGRISRDKGTDRAIKVAKMAKINLIIAGQVPFEEKEYFEKFIKPHINGKDIKWVGPVGPKERNDVMKNATASLHMINFNEPFGLTVAEAMACGTPVIAINKGSMPELIDNGVNGYLVNDENEALTAIKNINKIDRLMCRQKIAENFTLEKMASGYEEIYYKVLGKNI